MARPITVPADAKSRVYGDANPALTYQIGGSGLVNGDTLTGALATTATATSDVGNYGITQGSLDASSNYSLSYTGANLSVTARPITVTADAQSRVYGDANPALTYRIGGSGLVNGDSLTGALTTIATESSPIGSYAIKQGTLVASANYGLSYVGAKLDVLPRPAVAKGWTAMIDLMLQSLLQRVTLPAGAVQVSFNQPITGAFEPLTLFEYPRSGGACVCIEGTCYHIANSDPHHARELSTSALARACPSDRTNEACTGGRARRACPGERLQRVNRSERIGVVLAENRGGAHGPLPVGGHRV